MEKPSVLQQEWDKLLDKLQIHLEQKQYHLLSVELKLAAAILQQAVLSQLLASLSEATIGLIKNCLIAVGQAADEKDYRDQFHKSLLAQWHKILSYKQADLAKTLLSEVQHKAPSSIMVKTKYHFGHDFNALYVANSPANPYQVLKQEQENRLTRLEGSFKRNRYAVYAEIIVTYVRCLIRARKNFTAKHLAALGKFIESLSYIAVTKQTGHEELWHYILPLQIDLADELIHAHYQPYLEPKNLLDWQHAQSHKAGESLLLLQAVVHTLNFNKDLPESALVNWLQTVNIFINTLNTHHPQKITCELLQTEQHQQALAQYRKNFVNLETNYTEAQKMFSTLSLALLNQLTYHMAQLLGESPCEWALCATGSSARLDRRPYSDVELMLLYQAKPNASANHIQTYLYFLLGGLEIAIRQLGETHCEYTQAAHNAADAAGFHLDSSCHILREELFNTPQNMVAQYFLKSIPRKQAPDEIGEEWHDWLHNRKFYALLFPKLIIGNEDLLNFYSTELQRFLTADVNASDQLDKLAQALAWSSLTTVKLPRHQVIALSCLMQVLQESQQQLTKIKIGDWVNLKDVFYKPFTYLALNLKLFYSLKAEHPADIFEEAAAKLTWGASEITKLLQAVLSYIGQLQAKLHLQNSYQEECFKWLNLPTENSKTTLTAQEYAGLSLITDSLLLPLFQYSNNQLKIATNSCVLLDILPYLLKSHLAIRNASWLHRWSQHATHPLLLSLLLNHPLIQVLADYPSPNGWSPAYEQAMRRWLGELQSLTTEHKTGCLIEGIPTSAKPLISYLPAKIINQLFDVKGEFKGNVHDSKQSKVSQVTLQIPGQASPTTFYFKVKPGNEAGLMGREFAVIDLHQLLGGQSHIALGWPLKLTYLTAKGSKVYYCWVSEGISGQSLGEVMQDEKAFADFNNHLETESYSHLFITHYLTCPEDAQPDNFQVVQLSKRSKESLYGLDVGQSFVGTHDDKRKVLSVKTMLYLLEPIIYQTLDTQVLTRLMLLDPKALIKQWKTNLIQMNQLFKPLFEAELAKTRITKAQWSLHNQLIDLNEAVHLSVEKRLELLLNWLYHPSKKERSGALLLRTLEPAIALSYQSLRGKIKTPEDFYKIDPKAYVKNPNTGKMYSSTTYANIQQQTLTPERLQASLDLGEEYFAGIDFRKIEDEQEQRYVLALLQAATQNKKRVTYLNLSGCIVINESELFNLLQKVPDLKELYLEECPQFNFDTVFNLLSFKVNGRLIGFSWEYEMLCPVLKTLSITINDIVNKKQMITLAVTTDSRKQALNFIRKLQQQFDRYGNMLLEKLLLKQENEDWNTKKVSIQTITKLASKFSAKQINQLIRKLLPWLNDQDLDVREVTKQSLDVLIPLLSSGQIDELINRILPSLNDKDLDVQQVTMQSLGMLGSRLSVEGQEKIVKNLLFKLEHKYPLLQKAAIHSFSLLARKLPSKYIHVLFEKILFKLEHQDWEGRDAIFKIFNVLMPQFSTEQINQLIEKLLAWLENPNQWKHEAALENLNKFASRLSSDQVSYIIDRLLLRLDNQDFRIRYIILCSVVELAVSFSAKKINQVIEKLLFKLEDQHWRVKKLAIRSLVKLASKLSAKQISHVIGKLLFWLNDKDFDVQEVIRQSLDVLVPILSDSQINEMIEKMLPWLNDEAQDVREVAKQYLDILIPVLSSGQIDELINRILPSLNDKDLDVQLVTMQSLDMLGSRLSAEEQDKLVKNLLLGLGHLHPLLQKAAIHSFSLLARKLPSEYIHLLYEKLLFKLEDKAWKGKDAIFKIINVLVPQFSTEQVNQLIEKLLAWLENETHWRREVALKNLSKLAPQLSLDQVSHIIEKLLLRLDNQDSEIRYTTIQSLVKLSSKLSTEQINQLIEKLLSWLNDKDSGMRKVTRQSLDDLIPILLDEQINQMFEKMLPWLNDKDLDVREVAAQSLGKFAERLSAVQVETIVKASLDWLGANDLDAREVAAKSLGLLAAQLSEAQAERSIGALLNCLNDKDWVVQKAAFNTLAEYFSPASLLQWLQRYLLQTEDKTATDLNTNNIQTDQRILFKLFSCLDQKTLLQAVPQVNKDWRRWQKVYVQQQAEQQRLQLVLPPEENAKDEDAQATIPENSFNRFLL